MSEHRFAVIIPNEASLTAPIAAATELSKLYIIAATELERLHREIWTEIIYNSDGVETRQITHYPTHYKWFLEYCRKIGADIARTNQAAEIKEIDQKLQLLNIFLKTDAVSKEKKDKFVEMALKNKVLEQI
ncbi:MAG: hypothetical protein KAS04_06920 [Candidatus Aenigmarchaeota archaeon]|nr:hypothetical protein [Candidatus Aenigmarchaeota archaeon]